MTAALADGVPDFRVFSTSSSDELTMRLIRLRRLMGEMAERDRMGIMGMEGQVEMDRNANDPSTDGSQGEGAARNVVPFRPTPLDLPTDMSGPT